MSDNWYMISGSVSNIFVFSMLHRQLFILGDICRHRLYWERSIQIAINNQIAIHILMSEKETFISILSFLT